MDVVKDYQVIQNELAAYSDDLANKKQIVVINKIDLLDDESKDFLKDYFLQENKNVEDVMFISAIT
jgi:GTPase